MKVNLLLKSDGTIVGYQTSPICDFLPILEIDDPKTIHVGIDKYKDGKLSSSKTKVKSEEKKIADFKRVQELKLLLAQTDYLAIKHAEGLISDGDYEETKNLRQSYRDEINELEGGNE